MLRALLVACGLAGLAAAPGAAQTPPPPAPEPGVAPWLGRRLSRVEWVGRSALSTGALEAASGWKPGAAFDSAAWASLDERVAARYAREGYLAARVERVRLVPERDGLGARIEVAEGPRHRFGTLRIHGGGREGEVREALGLAPGEPWSAERLEGALAGLVERYRREGRPHTRVHVRRLWTEEDLAHCEIVVLESDTVWVDSVRVEGLVATSPGLVRRVSRGVAGAPYDPAAAEALRRRLADLGVFSRVEAPRLESGSARRAVLVYQVEERRANSATGVLGYQGKDAGPTGLLDLFLGNLGGSARQAELAWQGRGDGSSLFRLAYGEPLLPWIGARAGLRVDHELYDTTFVRTRAQLELGTPGGRPWDAACGFALERVVSGTGDSRSDRSELSLALGLGRIADGGLQAAPRGRRLAVGGAWAGRREMASDGGTQDGSLWTARLDGVWAGAAGREHHGRLELAGRLRSAAGQPVGIADQFPLGGVETLRGYREDAYRTERYLLLRSELGFGSGTTRPFLFLDQAAFARTSTDSTGERSTGYRVGYGAGLSQLTGAGRLGLVLAWGEGNEPLDAKLHLAFSTRF
jgi:outer membrane protein assembly factor BamA